MLAYSFVGVDSICTKSRGQNEVTNQPEGVFNTASEYDSYVNVAFCNEGACDTGDPSDYSLALYMLSQGVI